MAAKVNKSPLLSEGKYEVKDVKELNFFDLTGTKAKTKGSSNKSYHIELHVEKGGTQAQLYSMWGPTGGNQNKDWRYYDSEHAARKDFEKIIKSKKKKGYVEIDVAQRAYGSEEAKKITKTVLLANVDDSVTNGAKPTSLHPKVQHLVSSLFGSTNDFVIKTLKCPLGQLTNSQVDLGRDLLNEAKSIVNKKKQSKSDNKEIERITNDFYAAIPHNLGTGYRGQMTQLLLDTELKIAQKDADLDTLLDAKQVGAVLTSNNIDQQYESLSADIEYIPENSDLHRWVVNMVQETKARNHHWFNQISVYNVWKIERHDKYNQFVETAADISKKCTHFSVPTPLRDLVKNRPDFKNKSERKLFYDANILPLFHGTRTENLIGITKKGLLIRPSGAIITGAMYGNFCYMASNSTKSINYTNIRSSYWARGDDDRAFLFITDNVLGNPKIATRPYPYTKENIKPYHSVWAKAGSSVINDEFMLDTPQVMLKYLIEFGCQKN